MNPNQGDKTPDISWIPQGIPTWVFVPNNQVPVQAAPIPQTSPAQPFHVGTVDGPLDKAFKWLAKSVALITWQSDPITWAPNPNAKAIKKSEDIIGKVRGVANKVVAKATDVTSKVVDTATNVATQAAQQVQQIIPPPTAQQAQPPVQAPVVQAPVVPVPEVAPTAKSPSQKKAK